MNDRLKNIRKRTSLETRLSTLNRFAFIDLLYELGYRENKGWSLDEEEKLKKLCEMAEEVSKSQIAVMKQWEEDGKPTK